MPHSSPLRVTEIDTDTDPTIQVFTGPCVVGLAVLTAAAAASTLSVYDAVGATSNRIFFVRAGANLSEGFAGGRLWCANGCYIVTAGAGSFAHVGIE